MLYYKAMEIIKRILFYLSVPKCVACKEPLEYSDTAFCAKCHASFIKKTELKCANCLKPHNKCVCSNDLLDKAYVHKLLKLAKYGGLDKNTPVNPLIFSLKKDNRRDVLNFIARNLSPVILNEIKDFSGCVFVNVPRMRSSIVKYGYDHAAELAKVLAKQLGAEYMPLLISKNKAAQKSKSGEDRLKNAHFDIKECDLSGKTVIIIDDIVTTGASMSACAELLHRSGAKRIIGTVVAYAFRDSRAERRRYRMQSR